ncbi:MAG: arsenate reductase ArsC [Planctomycetes bacterium]|nr:arsenate reductase ArsC [Planctomycetota bacterium]
MQLNGSTRSVLFLCTRNAARSQMAEAILRAHGGERFEVHSAGLEPGEIDPLAVQVMHESGILLTNHRPKSAAEYLGRRSFTFAITLCDPSEDDCPRMFLGALQHLYWPHPDPSLSVGTDEQRLDAYRRLRDRLSETIQGWLADVSSAPQPALMA